MQMTEKKKTKFGSLLSFHNTASHLMKKHASLSLTVLTFHSIHVQVLHDKDNKGSQYTSPRHSRNVCSDIRVKMANLVISLNLMHVLKSDLIRSLFSARGISIAAVI